MRILQERMTNLTRVPLGTRTRMLELRQRHLGESLTHMRAAAEIVAAGQCSVPISGIYDLFVIHELLKYL